MIQRLRVCIWSLSIILILYINITVFEILGLFLLSGRNDMKESHSVQLLGLRAAEYKNGSP